MSTEVPPTQRSANELVRRGIALLDERGPSDWRRRVDVAALDVYDPWRCVLGQVYDEYSIGVNALNPVEPASSYGFDCRVDEAPELTAAWRATLTSPGEPTTRDGGRL